MQSELLMSEPSSIPQHIAIIMDGNGRWAKKRFLPRVSGHKEGMNAVKRVAIAANQLGVKVLTLYAFSTENWQRPKDEVNFLMKLPIDFFKVFMPEIMANQIKIETIGAIDQLPKETYQQVVKAKEQTRHHSGMILNFALNYGAQDEISRAVRDIVAQGIPAEAIDKACIADHLETRFLGDYANPDLIIRTSGELRLSNFLLWQAAYSEFYFTDLYWPDFDKAALYDALVAYQKRQRRFGKL